MARPPYTENNSFLFNYPDQESLELKRQGRRRPEPAVEALERGGTWSRIQAFHDIRDLGDELAEVWD